MRGQSLKLNYLALLMIVGLTACGGSKTAKINRNTSITPTDRSIETPTTTHSVRYCDPFTSPINTSSASKLYEFFGVPVSGLEEAPSFCHSISGFGSNVNMDIMFEYEDNKGIRSVSFTADQIISRNLNTSVQNSDHYVLDIIYRDSYGLVRINAAGPKSTGVLTGNVFFYNFPSYEEALDEAIKQLQKECQNGTKTVYECLGYTYPTHWWNQSIQTSAGQRMKELAISIMSDGAKRRHLGGISLNIADSTFPN